jgi:hypothetical protein
LNIETQTDRKWFPAAARIHEDMRRGLYWTEKGIKKKPNKDGDFPVVQKDILRALGIDVNYHNARVRIWTNPYFLRALEQEQRRRNLGLQTVAKEMEKVVGPLHETREKVIKHVKDIFDRAPDAEDPECLSPKDYVSSALQWIKYIDETEGRTESDKQATLEDIMRDSIATSRVSAEMVGSAMELLLDHRRQQDERLKMAGVIEGDLVDD